MGVYVDITRELMTRFTAATVDGAKLQGTKFYMGARTMVERLEDMPSVVVTNLSISEQYTQISSSQLNAVIDFDLVVKFPLILPSAQDNLTALPEGDGFPLTFPFTFTDNQGFLYWVEKLFDVISESSAGAADPRLNQTSRRAVKLSMQNLHIIGTNCIIADVFLRGLETKFFGINGRATA